MSNEALIHMYTCEACTLTTEEFERLVKELTSNFMANDMTVVDRICCRLVYEHYSRYHEAVIKNNGAPSKEVRDFVSWLTNYYRKLSNSLISADEKPDSKTIDTFIPGW